MQIHQWPDPTAAKELLRACGLPTEDLTAEHFEHFFVSGAVDKPAGIVGVEFYGSSGLLRSLAVAPSSRGRGLAKLLIAEAEVYARRHGSERLYLLTETAEPLFESVGYDVESRDMAPAGVRSSTQFKSLCPASATFMVKQL